MIGKATQPRIIPPWVKSKNKVALMDLPYRIPYKGYVMWDYHLTSSSTQQHCVYAHSGEIDRKAKFVRFIKDNSDEIEVFE